MGWINLDKTQALKLVSGIVIMAAAVWGYLYFMKQTEIMETTMTTIKPSRLLQSGEIIDATMLRQVIIAASAHHKEAIRDPQLIIGQTVNIPIGQEEEIIHWKLAESRLVPGREERYYSFKTDAITNVNNMIRKGDRVDVWVELEQPKLIQSPEGYRSVGAIKIIEGLVVTGVKTSEGLEVVDTNGTLDSFIRSDAVQLGSSRGKAGGKPDMNTYIMDDQVYEAYVLGNVGGRIKLALPNLMNMDTSPARVTNLFQEMKRGDGFSKISTRIYTESILKETDVRKSEVIPAVSVNDTETKPNLPTVKEVKS